MQNRVTFHAPAKRLSYEEIKDQIQFIRQLPNIPQVVDAVSAMVLILNDRRQVVFANKPFLRLFGIEDSAQLSGERHGEIVKCVRVQQGTDGCGTSDACKYCGIVSVILEAVLEDKDTSGEGVVIHTMSGYEQGINLAVHVAPVKFDLAGTFYVLTMTDISDTVKRRTLERIFFHDITNTVGALRGLIELLKADVPEQVRPEIDFLESSMRGLLAEIQGQKQLADAENGELRLKLEKMSAYDVLISLKKIYQGHEVAQNKTIDVEESGTLVTFCSDRILLERVLGNMLKNALEATEAGGSVSIGCDSLGERDSHLRFWVHNDAYMPDEIQYSLFQQAISAKDSGRGLGTYSMKLLGEKYLQGNVGFFTDEEYGTTFFFRLPITRNN